MTTTTIFEGVRRWRGRWRRYPAEEAVRRGPMGLVAARTSGRRQTWWFPSRGASVRARRRRARVRGSSRSPDCSCRVRARGADADARMTRFVAPPRSRLADEPPVAAATVLPPGCYLRCLPPGCLPRGAYLRGARGAAAASAAEREETRRDARGGGGGEIARGRVGPAARRAVPAGGRPSRSCRRRDPPRPREFPPKLPRRGIRRGARARRPGARGRRGTAPPRHGRRHVATGRVTRTVAATRLNNY